MLRKTLFTACAALALALSACTSGGPSVPFATVQAESRTITTAINTLAPALIAAMPAANRANATSAVAALDAANATLQATTSSTSTVQAVENVVNLVSSVTAVLPLPANTELAINAGTVLIDAFLGALPQPATATPAIGAASGPVVPGPIPVPLD